MSAERKYMQLLTEMVTIYKLAGHGTIEALSTIYDMTYYILEDAGIDPDNLPEEE